MKKEKYHTTKYRVRPGTKRLIKYFEWKELFKKEENQAKNVVDMIVKHSIRLMDEGKVKFKRDLYRNRKDHSITLSTNTIKEIEKKHKNFKCYKGEFIEICLYIYAKKYLTEDEIELNQLDNWLIEVTFLGVD